MLLYQTSCVYNCHVFSDFVPSFHKTQVLRSVPRNQNLWKTVAGSRPRFRFYIFRQTVAEPLLANNQRMYVRSENLPINGIPIRILSTTAIAKFKDQHMFKNPILAPVSEPRFLHMSYLLVEDRATFCFIYHDMY